MPKTKRIMLPTCQDGSADGFGSKGGRDKPDSPKSPTQKYYLTEKGKQLLKQL